MTDDSTALKTRRAEWLLVAALAIACGLQAFETRSRGIDPDEFEHLHAAYMVYRGEVPYRDFFEHHGPGLYYLVQPLFRSLGADHAVLWLARFLLWGCSLGILALTWRIANRLSGRPAGLVAATLLAWTTIFQAKGIELRPDVPAALLVTVSLALALDESATWRRWVSIGLLAGLATLFTQKSIVPVAGITLAACARAWQPGNRRALVSIPLSIGAGGALAWGLAAMAFALADAQGAFFHGTVEQLLAWPVRSRRWDQLRPTLVAEPTVWCAGAIAVISALRSGAHPGSRQEARRLVAIASVVAIGSLAWVKATYAQFYFLWFPWLAALAACQLVAWSRKDAHRTSLLPAALLGAILIAAQWMLAGRAFQLQTLGALPNLFDALRNLGIAPSFVLTVALAVAAWALVCCVRGRAWSALISVISTLGMFHAVLRAVDGACWSNREQLRRMAVLERYVGPSDTVLDGYSGYGALRPHATYYWWINEYSLALMSPEVRESDLLILLRARPPTAVLFDRDLARLPASVTGWIRAHYEPLEDETWLWLPKGEADRSVR